MTVQHISTIGLIGAGNIGSQLARLGLQHGYRVVLSNSRGPETLADLVAELGDGATAATAEEAAAQGDVVVVTIPLKAIDRVPVPPLRDKLVIDTNNYYPQRDGRIDALEDGSATTTGLVQQHFPGAKVVKAFNNIYSAHLDSMQRPADHPDRNTLMIAGDDPGAKREVTAFVEAIGYDVFDTGSTADSWRFQRDQAAYADAYAEGGDFERPITRSTVELQALLEKADPSIH